MAESVSQQVFRPSGDIISRTFSGSEPSRRPRSLPDRPKMAADIIEHRRDFLLREVLDQPEQFLPLHAHEPSVRSHRRGGGTRSMADRCRYWALAQVRQVAVPREIPGRW